MAFWLIIILATGQPIQVDRDACEAIASLYPDQVACVRVADI